MGEAIRPPSTHYAVANLVAGIVTPWRAPLAFPDPKQKKYLAET